MLKTLKKWLESSFCDKRNFLLFTIKKERLVRVMTRFLFLYDMMFYYEVLLLLFGRSPHFFNLVTYLLDCLLDCLLTYWLTDWLTDWLAGWLAGWLDQTLQYSPYLVIFLFAYFNLNTLYPNHLVCTQWSFVFQTFDYFWRHVLTKLF